MVVLAGILKQFHTEGSFAEQSDGLFRKTNDITFWVRIWYVSFWSSTCQAACRSLHSWPGSYHLQL